MKNFIVVCLLVLFMGYSLPAFALSEENSEHLRDNRVQPEEPVNAPRWTDYVPKKYENPRTDFSRGSSIAELVAGIVLTDLIITCPIGIPMICHSTTKLKNISYANKKDRFFEGLEEAEKLPADEQKQYYEKLLKKCKMKEYHID